MKALLTAGVGILLAGATFAAETDKECQRLNAQVRAETDRRLDDGSYRSKILAMEAESLCSQGKKQEAVAKFEEAAKAAGLELQGEKK
jgi:hypothetical protein